MRMIGRAGEEDAAVTFGDFLYAQGIENEIRPEPDGTFGIWVHAEPQVDRARALFADFRENPSDPRYDAHRGEASRQREERAQADAAHAARIYNRDKMWPGMGAAGMLSVILIAISVAVSVPQLLGMADLSNSIFSRLFISRYVNAGLTEVAQGQVWRLVTPIFLHFNVLHLLFNMLWLRDLGGMVERVRGTARFGLLVLALALASNLAQFYWHGPGFGGMSGVVYGLLGYVWMKGRFDRASGLFVHQSTVNFMVGWMVLGFTGLLSQYIGSMANLAHLAGLAAGVALGFASAQMARLRQ